MSNFKMILEEIKLETNNKGIFSVNAYIPINGLEWHQKLKMCEEGEKDGSHFLRSEILIPDNGIKTRKDENMLLSRVLIIDCDEGLTQTKLVSIDAQSTQNCPEPKYVHEALNGLGIGHIIYGTYSGYVDSVRYRIILLTDYPFNKEQLKCTAQFVVNNINQELLKTKQALLAYAKENNSFSQPWYYPRKPTNSNKDNIYFENLDGKVVEVQDVTDLPELTISKDKDLKLDNGEISVIDEFNKRYSVKNLMDQYGYVLVSDFGDQQRFLRPNSTSNQAGIVVKNEKFFSFHNDLFNDGYWHDAWDLNLHHEGLSTSKAIEKYSKLIVLNNGQSIHQYNRSLFSKNKKEEQKGNFVIDEVLPCDYPIEPCLLLNKLKEIISMTIVADETTIDSAVLWIAMTWFIDVIQVAPLAVITAPEKRCGKSTMLFLLNKLVNRPLMASNITPAALFRTIEMYRPTIMIDEADTFVKDNEELRGVLNCGHTRDSAFVIRTVGKDHEPKRFNVWGAKALAGIGACPDTIMDRAIVLELRRKLPEEKVNKIRHIPQENFDILRSELARFSNDFSQSIKIAQPELPSFMNDRAQDNWEPLFAIAAQASLEWLERATRSATKLSNEEIVYSTGTELLFDIQEILEAENIERIKTIDLIYKLCADEEKQWASFNKGKQITPRQLSKLLKEYQIKSGSIRINFENAKGYYAKDFQESFSRYLSSNVDIQSNVTTSQFKKILVQSVADKHFCDGTTYINDTASPSLANDCDVVTDKKAMYEEVL
jgi:hypothetical protein